MHRCTSGTMFKSSYVQITGQVQQNVYVCFITDLFEMLTFNADG